MAWQFSLYQIPPLVATLVSLAVVYLTWNYRSKPTGSAFILCMAGVFEWSLTYTLQLGFTGMSTQVLFGDLGYLGAVVVPAAWLVLTARYANRDRWLARWSVGLLAIEPAATLLLLATNGAHGLLYRYPTMVADAGFPVVTFTYGTWYWFNLGYSYLCIGVGLVFLLGVFFRGRLLYRRQASLLILGAVVPLVANALFATGMSPLPEVDLTTFTFSITGIVFAVGLFQFDLLNRTPVAQQQMNEMLGDGLVVVDAAGVVVDYNGTAKRIFGGELDVGRHADELFPDGGLDSIEGVELSVQIDGRTRYYHGRESPLSGRRGEHIGHMLALRHVTDRKGYEQRLEVANRILRHNLRNESNIVLGHADALCETLSGEEAESARVIRRTAERLGDLSWKARRLEATLHLEDADPIAVDAVPVIEGEVERFRETNPEAVIQTGLPETARVRTLDADLLGYVVGNLIENAVVHNDRPPRVTVTMRPDDPVRISVADNGPGIPDQEHEVLSEGHETSLQHGSGIGLWLVHWIVTASGGSVSFVENRPRGSVVTVSFPAV